MTARFSEDLPLVKDSYNFFNLIVMDSHSNVMETDVGLIGISQGKYQPSGTPLSHDICLEIDSNPDFESGQTKLDLFFQKNSILPLKRTKMYPLHKSITKGTDDEIVISVLEGPHTSIPEANSSIGYFKITGRQVERDIARTADIEITIELSESLSGDLKVTAYIPMSDQSFTKVFTMTGRHTTVEKVKEDMELLSERITKEIQEAVEREDYEVAGQLTDLMKNVEVLSADTRRLQNDDVTDKKYQYEDRKRDIAQQFYEATKEKHLSVLKQKYNEGKEWCRNIVDENGNDHDRKMFSDIVGREEIFLNSNTPVKVMEAVDDLVSLGSSILWRTPAFIETRFRRLLEKPQLFNDQEQAKSLIEAGNLAIADNNHDRLKEVTLGLISLLPKNYQQEAKTGKIGFDFKKTTQ